MPFVTRAYLEINGRVIPISKVKEDDREQFIVVKQMFSTAFAQKTIRFAGDFVYEVPNAGAEVFENDNGGTLTIEMDGGDRIDFGGVYYLTIGSIEFDMEKAASRTIKWGAQTRNGNDGSTLLPS
jgi:hypothetical protein